MNCDFFAAFRIHVEASKIKHHPNIILETFFIKDLRQKKSQFVIRINYLGRGRESFFISYRLLVIMWFLFEEVSSSSGCLGWAALFYCGTP